MPSSLSMRRGGWNKAIGEKEKRKRKGVKEGERERETPEEV